MTKNKYEKHSVSHINHTFLSDSKNLTCGLIYIQDEVSAQVWDIYRFSQNCL